MKLILVILIFTSLILSCNSNKVESTNKLLQQIVMQEENLTPTVDIKNFTLLSANLEAEKADAIEILKVKRNWPLAMQKKDSALFEKILAKQFIIRGEDEFLNRADYIKDRIHGTWTIDTVRYQNLVLQFFGDMAVLTYRNTLDGTDADGKPDIEHYTWADMYTKENGGWKILSSHCIDAKIEYPAIIHLEK